MDYLCCLPPPEIVRNNPCFYLWTTYAVYHRQRLLEIILVSVTTKLYNLCS